MDTIQDFEDILHLFDKYQVRYLVIGGLAFIYHAKPRYTKDMDLWVDPDPKNVEHANAALQEFGSPLYLDSKKPNEIVQIGLPPNRIDLLLRAGPFDFAKAWQRRIEGRYGGARACWLDLDTLLEMKRRLDDPRHQEDVRVLQKVKQRRKQAGPG